MKKLIVVLVMAYASNCNTKEITFDITGKAEISGFTFKDTSSYKLYQSNGHWKSSSGDFGLHTCLGTVINKNNKNDFSVYCKNVSQNNDYFIMHIYRDSEFKESGAGKALIIETSDNFKHLLNAECSHAITYLDSDYFALQKCKF